MAVEEGEASESASRVFATFELLEMILVNTLHRHSKEDIWQYNTKRRIRALFRLQRVNSTFRNVIARSKALNIAMFRRFESGVMNEFEATFMMSRPKKMRKRRERRYQ